LADEFPSITLVDAHAALAYSLNHRAEAEVRPVYQTLQARLVAARESRVET
jgi:hypothetical protein